MKIQLSSKSEMGTSLAEVVIAVAILAIMAAGLITSLNYGFFVMDLVRENQRATQVLLEKTETIRLYSWAQVNEPGFVQTQFNDLFDPQENRGVTYYGTVNIAGAPFTNSYSDSIRQVVINIVWTNRTGLVRTRSLTTIVAKDGVQNYVY